MRLILLLLLTFSLSSQAYADGPFSDQNCVNVYRDNTLFLEQVTRQFNEGQIGRFDFASKVSAISTVVSTNRLGCLIFESHDVERCVDRYKTLYKSLRQRIKVPSVLRGNQTEVSIPTLLKTRVEGADLLCKYL